MLIKSSNNDISERVPEDLKNKRKLNFLATSDQQIGPTEGLSPLNQKIKEEDN